MSKLHLLLFAAFALVLAGCKPKQAPVAQVPGAGVRLPVEVTPERYDITITPDAQAGTFKGSVRIGVRVQGDTRRVIVNAVELAIDRAVLADGTAAKVELDAKAQTATFTFPKALKAGAHVLLIDYRGKINPFSAGLFSLDYPTAEGTRRMLVTQFESADFRRFAPSWDQPDRKAVFQLNVIAPRDQAVIGNMPAQAVQQLPNGLKKVAFQPTPKMSTYLMFLGMGDLERVSRNVDGVDVGVVTRRGATDKAKFALDAGAELLRYYNDYFGVKYPLPKLDLVAAPGAGGFGAMENWGAILFFENYLLVDPRLSTEDDRRTNYIVISHEIAHMWFGDLVTMAWWDDLWLNESFASWMENKSTSDLHPKWNQQLVGVTSRETAMRLDATSATHPIVQPAETLDQVNQIGDAITYQKGEAVIRMIERYVGAEAFREGVRAYIKAHAYGNATRGDLWRAIEMAAKKPLMQIAHDFTEQAGVPQVRVDNLPSGKTAQVILRQGRFAVDEASRKTTFWRIPVLARALSGGPEVSEVLTPGPVVQSLSTPAAPPILINYGQSGYFRTLYAQSLFEALAKRLGALRPVDQLGLVYDSWALGSAGYAPVANVLELVERMPAGADPQVWAETVGILSEIDGLYEGSPQQAAFRDWARARLQPLMARVGWEPRGGEDPSVSLLRVQLITAMSAFGDEAVIAEARARFERFRADPASLSADQRQSVLRIVGEHADAATFEQLRALARAASDPQEQRQFLTALSRARDPKLADKAMQLALSAEAPTTLGPVMIRTVAAYHPEQAWRFAQAHPKELSGRLDPSQVLSFVPGLIGAASDARLADQLHAYAEKTYQEGGRREADKVESAVRHRARVRAERLPEIDRWLQLAQTRSDAPMDDAA
jgi:aminopeptidase N